MPLLLTLSSWCSAPSKWMWRWPSDTTENAPEYFALPVNNLASSLDVFPPAGMWGRTHQGQGAPIGLSMMQQLFNRFFHNDLQIPTTEATRSFVCFVSVQVNQPWQSWCWVYPCTVPSDTMLLHAPLLHQLHLQQWWRAAEPHLLLHHHHLQEVHCCCSHQTQAQG
jgi:hypothetical protein